jgi:hypothetical protein
MARSKTPSTRTSKPIPRWAERYIRETATMIEAYDRAGDHEPARSGEREIDRVVQSLRSQGYTV